MSPWITLICIICVVVIFLNHVLIKVDCDFKLIIV